MRKAIEWRPDAAEVAMGATRLFFREPSVRYKEAVARLPMAFIAVKAKKTDRLGSRGALGALAGAPGLGAAPNRGVASD